MNSYTTEASRYSESLLLPLEQSLPIALAVYWTRLKLFLEVSMYGTVAVWLAISFLKGQGSGVFVLLPVGFFALVIFLAKDNPRQRFLSEMALWCLVIDLLFQFLPFTGNEQALRLSRLANTPTSASNQSQAKEILATAKKEGLRIPVEAIEDGGKRFVDAAKDSPGAWDVAVNFVDYRSHLNAGTATDRQFLKTTPGRDLDFKYNYNSRNGYPRPTISTGMHIVAAADAANIHPLGEMGWGTYLGLGADVIFFDGGSIELNNLLMRHVVVRNSAIFYSGGSFQLEDVVFINCKFFLARTPIAQQFARAALSNVNITFQPS